MRIIALACLIVGLQAALVFEELPYAQGTDKHLVLTSSSVFIPTQNLTIPIQYNTLFRTGYVDNNGDIEGLMVDRQGLPIYEITMEGSANTSAPDVSHEPDFASLLPVGDKLYMVVHHEDPSPSTMYVVELKQQVDGALVAFDWYPVDWSEYGGLMYPCAGSVSPWNTHLGSEECWFCQDAFDLSQISTTEELKHLYYFQRHFQRMMRYFGVYPQDLTLEILLDNFKPYMYGYVNEVSIDESGNITAVKHFAIGRVNNELGYVLPDEETLYRADDQGNNGVLTVFKASEKGDLSCGTLYAAAVNQVSSVSGGAFTLDWIDLGLACDEDLLEIAETTTFSDLFDYVAPDVTKFDPLTGCPEDYVSVNNPDAVNDCLKLKEGMEIPASRFETRRYAAYMGATVEWTKMEGITYDDKRNKMYIAMSRIHRGMEDFKKSGEPNSYYDFGGSNDIRLEYNPCGCVYSIDLDIDNFGTSIQYLVCGDPENPLDEFNSCDIDGIANPDNLAYITGYDGLLIGEDSGSGHQNDIVWYYDLEGGSLTRILSTPYGSETTSPYYYADLNGHAYIMTVVQHPYDESDRDKVEEKENTGVNGWIGYIGPLPVATTES